MFHMDFFKTNSLGITEIWYLMKHITKKKKKRQTWETRPNLCKEIQEHSKT